MGDKPYKRTLDFERPLVSLHSFSESKRDIVNIDHDQHGALSSKHPEWHRQFQILQREREKKNELNFMHMFIFQGRIRIQPFLGLWVKF